MRLLYRTQNHISEKYQHDHTVNKLTTKKPTIYWKQIIKNPKSNPKLRNKTNHYSYEKCSFSRYTKISNINKPVAVPYITPKNTSPNPHSRTLLRHKTNKQLDT